MTWKCRRLLYEKKGGRGDFAFLFLVFFFNLASPFCSFSAQDCHIAIPSRLRSTKQRNKETTTNNREPSTNTNNQLIKHIFLAEQRESSHILFHLPSPTTMNASWHRHAMGRQVRERSRIAQISSAILLVAMAIPALVQAGPGRPTITTTEFRSSPRKLSYFQDSAVRRRTHVSRPLILWMDVSPSYKTNTRLLISYSCARSSLRSFSFATMIETSIAPRMKASIGNLSRVSQKAGLPT